MPTIDLRSDTVTTPTPEMRRAMAEAEVGDDVYGEDPTVNRLQAMLAEMAGFEAGLFVSSGTMSNQAAIAAHTRPGYEVICPEGAHIYEYEPGAMAVIASVMPRLVPAPGGVPDPAVIASNVHESVHQSPTGLITLENTHNRAGGTVVPQAVSAAVQRVARGCRLPIHLDGARAFNAATALGLSVAEVCAGFDSVSICLSKGLGAPVGSVLLGSRDFLKEAHRFRKLMGGGMRQAGVLAAAGIVAISTMPARLGDDHRRARRLAESLNGTPGLTIDLASVQTNMVYLKVAAAPALAKRCAASGLLFNALGPTSVRLVTHHQLSDEQVTRAIELIRDEAGQLAATENVTSRAGVPA